jgi:O-acetylserine/cysteine efflux transporter
MTHRGRLVFPALAAAGILWGTTVPLSKLALAWLAPGWLAFARFALAAALLTVVSRSRLRANFRPAILVTGAAGYGGSVLLQNLGIERTSVTHAALLIGATPVLVAVLAAVVGLGVARPVGWLGFGLSLAGVSVIAAGRGAGSSLAGDGLVLAAQLAAAGFTVSQVAAASPVAMLATGGLVLAGTVLPMTLFAFAQSQVPAAVAGAFLNLEPLFGALVGILLFGDPLGPAQVAGGAAVVAGLGLSSYEAVRTERSPQPAGAAVSRSAGAPAGTAGRSGAAGTAAGAAAWSGADGAPTGAADRSRLAGRRTGPGRTGPRLSSRPGLALSGHQSYQRGQPQVTRRPANVHGELVTRRYPGRRPTGRSGRTTGPGPSAWPDRPRPARHGPPRGPRGRAPAAPGPPDRQAGPRRPGRPPCPAGCRCRERARVARGRLSR